MTQDLELSSVAGVDVPAVPGGDRAGTLVDLAEAWMSAEAASIRQPGRVELVESASQRAHEYEEALASATPDEVRLAWERAVARQARHPIGSPPWTAASRIAELLRFECEANPASPGS